MMFRWLRETIVNHSPVNSLHPSIISSKLSSTKEKNSMFIHSSTDDEDEDEEQIPDQTFFHHPHHQIKYIDLPEHRFISEYTYSTSQIRDESSSQSIDEQIYQKLLRLQHRSESILPSKSFPPSSTNDDDEEEEKSPDHSMIIDEEFSSLNRDRDEKFDVASVVFWYRNVMQSMKHFM